MAHKVWGATGCQASHVHLSAGPDSRFDFKVRALHWLWQVMSHYGSVCWAASLNATRVASAAATTNPLSSSVHLQGAWLESSCRPPSTSVFFRPVTQILLIVAQICWSRCGRTATRQVSLCSSKAEPLSVFPLVTSASVFAYTIWPLVSTLHSAQDPKSISHNTQDMVFPRMSFNCMHILDNQVNDVMSRWRNDRSFRV